MRVLGIDYGDSRIGLAITDPLGITAQGLKTIHHNGNDKIALKQIEEVLNNYDDIEVFAIGMPFNMDGSESVRMKVTNQFIHKLKCRFSNIRIESIDERLTTVEAHNTMNFLGINKYKKRNIVDTISAVYILEKYMKMQK